MRLRARNPAHAVTIMPPGLPRQDTLIDGREKLLRPFKLEIDGEMFTCPEGFVHDGSSWPRCVPGPRQKRIKLAGIVHDYAFQFATHGEGGRKLSFIQSNRLWYKVARAGSHKGAKASWFWAWAGRIGLGIGSLPVWIKYRMRDKREES